MGPVSGVKQNAEHLSQPRRYYFGKRDHHFQTAGERVNDAGIRLAIWLVDFRRDGSTGYPSAHQSIFLVQSTAGLGCRIEPAADVVLMRQA